jgi:hypothetical protein
MTEPGGGRECRTGRLPLARTDENVRPLAGRPGTADAAHCAGRGVVNRPAAELGLAGLEAGGDFADGAIAYEGACLGGETFVSFDQKTVAPLSTQGEAAQLSS